MYGIAIVDPANGYKKLMVEKTSGSGELDRKFYDADALEFQSPFQGPNNEPRKKI
jgi:nitrite reductase (NO-forming)